MELWEYIEVLFRWSWVILLVTALCTAAAFGFIKLQTPRYTSLVEVSVTPSRLELELSQEVVNLFRNYISSIQSEGMARRVIERLGLDSLDAAILHRQIQAQAIEDEFKIKIEVTNREPIFAQRVAQAVAQVFVEDVQAFALRQDPLDRLTATMLNGGAQAAGQTWPRKKLLVATGAGGGLMLGLLVALALEWARVEMVQTSQEVEQWLGLPVLGSIPALKQPGRFKANSATDSVPLKSGRLRKY
jgi:capsular polysaccharide biosynthesis protein